MKHLIIYAHPYEGSYNHAILETVTRGLGVNSNNDVTVIDLVKEGFNPVMSVEDLKAFNEQRVVDEKVLTYQKHIDEADHIVVIFPIWYTTMPAVLKGFFDKTFTKGFAYIVDPKNGLPKPNIKGKTATVISTMGGPNFYYDFIVKKPVEWELIKGTLKFSGIKTNKWFKLGNVTNVSEGKRKAWLQDIEKYFSEISAK